MREIKEFSLERHAGEYEIWPKRSRLLRDGTPLSVTLPGYNLVRQYDTVDGYLFVTDYDCMYEEITNFIFVDKNTKWILSERAIGQIYSTFLLDDIIWQSERHFTAILSKIPFLFTIRHYFVPYLYPKLGVKWPPRSK